MGVISILLGFIAFFAFTAAGAIVANFLLDLVKTLAAMMTRIVVPQDGTVIAICVAVFAFIGLLIGMNLFMQGLTYIKVSKIQKQLRHRG